MIRRIIRIGEEKCADLGYTAVYAFGGINTLPYEVA